MHKLESIEKDITKFMELFGQTIPKIPTVPTPEVRLLRAKLIMEEAMEQVNALGCLYNVWDGIELKKELYEPISLTAIADGVIDQIYVSLGTTVACGISASPLWDIVQAANIAKAEGKIAKREDGKALKPSGWIAPEAAIEKEIRTQQGIQDEVPAE